MKLILVRHGETEWVRQGRYQGSTDVPLNKRGFLQAKAVARRLKEVKPSIIYSSQLKRAQETANAIAQKCRKKILVDSRLNELSFGRWEGEYHEQVRLRFPNQSRHWYRARWTSRPPGGESLRSLEKRVSSFLTDLTTRFKNGQTCVLVTHGGPIRMFLIRVLGIEPRIFWTLRIDPASVSVVNLQTKELMLLNGQTHLNGLKRGGNK